MRSASSSGPACRPSAGPKLTLGELRDAPGHAEPQPGGNQVGGFRGTAQRRGHDRVPLVAGQDGDGVARLAAADVVQRNVGGSLQPALCIPVRQAMADKGKRRKGHGFHSALMDGRPVICHLAPWTHSAVPVFAAYVVAWVRTWRM